ncbi:hypothetical protein F441_19521 [Phytophthora nicotianae CJ01A1]|uniref:Uncharacterized protein n=5 Tax=Phytophthora nicotianae TaxID=4792 RepID=V9E3H1_PHYNI|nr:hypothetical protein F443_20311 [Phytophthora nicotianae P1569]ETK74018.1 hypothetical protein L915_19114 [Phytophthora nicotianae]ETO61701.1 hypothetical protein F444_20318 [Phytophthora nicotianae P1976]ETP03549.1 hypothetical protein F441_19521 [Phytophthora nicotianae CJ01A1]ETP31707.1 hypothetical protein F442_19461 [Phytophthora nicotianae P10297]
MKQTVGYMKEQRSIFDGYTIFVNPPHDVRKFIVSGFKTAGLSTCEQVLTQE